MPQLFTEASAEVSHRRTSVSWQPKQEGLGLALQRVRVRGSGLGLGLGSGLRLGSGLGSEG